MTLDGQPIDEGVIQFLPVEGTVGPETGGVISKGQYDIPRKRARSSARVASSYAQARKQAERFKIPRVVQAC